MADRRQQAMRETRTRILDAALEVLGRDPEAGMAAVATAAGVVRRTVYGHFPTRRDLVHALAQRAAEDLAAVLRELEADGASAERAWVGYVTRIWPVTARYRVLILLRRGEHGDDIHEMLRLPDALLAELVARGQHSGRFGRHLPPALLGQIAQGIVFTLAAEDLGDTSSGLEAAVTSSLLVLGVPRERVDPLVSGLATPGS